MDKFLTLIIYMVAVILVGHGLVSIGEWIKTPTPSSLNWFFEPVASMILGIVLIWVGKKRQTSK